MYIYFNYLITLFQKYKLSIAKILRHRQHTTLLPRRNSSMKKLKELKKNLIINNYPKCTVESYLINN